MSDQLPPPAGGPAAPYDALLLLSFGGPEGPDDVVPFLENVTRGRGIPRERLKEVGQHYFGFGGVSPINAQNRALLDALRKDFAEHGLDLPVYWGNRNWAPYLTDVMREMAADGRRRIAVLATSAYASYSGCRQYRENLADALATLAAEGVEPPRVDKLRHYFNHPGFVDPMIEGVVAALAELPEAVREGAHLAFTTHSIPTAAADTSGPVEDHTGGGEGGAYVKQHLDVARVIADEVAVRTGVARPWKLVYQSRSGAPHIPWLEPDICDHLEALHAEGAPAVVMVPIGFVSDHMEVLYDLDTEATARAAELGLPVARSATVGADPSFAGAVRELVLERAAKERGESAEECWVGLLGQSHDLCAVGCCPARSPRPAAAGADSPY
ncbi:putative ferrochelatase [Streptomyces virginiae]|uniref:Coproporphyrin III ferrochelatase n=1 Tax=Streptomyces virginiae TaxID=1961 RepID=A0ABQ3NG15_STRVG|nr:MULTISPECIES: ferrochelatase [Streptomyces]MBP2347034.1 ferrochelatase [Streptomyces virginiae]MCI4084248.1 ferrochelatase [Streptomyces sp. MMS21 TC-5]GGQ01564.1 putative ferrochelatase [Streptomyces virginiae]GHI11728.1 putative ferrochelatase [Streptomyces virginiae]